MGRPRKPKNTAPTKKIGELSGYLVKDAEIQSITKNGNDHVVAYFELAGSDNGNGRPKLVKVDAFDMDISDELAIFKKGQFIRVQGFVKEYSRVVDGVAISGLNIVAIRISRTF